MDYIESHIPKKMDKKLSNAYIAKNIIILRKIFWI